MKTKKSTLTLGILLLALAVGVIMIGQAIEENYMNTGKAGIYVDFFFAENPAFFSLATIALLIFGALMIAGAALIIFYVQDKNPKYLTIGGALIGLALLTYWTCDAMYRRTALLTPQDPAGFNYNLRIHLLIGLGLIVAGIAKGSKKLWIAGLCVIPAAFLIRWVVVGKMYQDSTAYVNSMAGKGIGFNYRILYMNPPLFISLTAVAWILGIIFAVAGLAIFVSSIMGSVGLRAGRITTNALIYILLTLISIIWLIPFVCIVLQSFRVESTWQVGYVIPQTWGFQNYVDLFQTNFPRWYINTFVIALCVAVLQTVIVLCMSYTLSRFRFKMRQPLMRFMLVLTLFPGMLTMIILYRVLADIGLTQAHAVPGLILVYVASSGMGYYVSKGFFDTIPKSLDEAARVDGATRAQVLYKIILPLSKPIVIYTILTAFMGPWGDYVFARYISMNEPVGMNVAVGLYSWLSNDQIAKHYTHFCAGGVLVAIPVTILFMCLQRYYVEGVTGGAVKG